MAGKKRRKKKDPFKEVLEELKKYEEGTSARSVADLTCQCGHNHGSDRDTKADS